MRKITQYGNVKVYFNSEWQEYIVKPSSNESEWYYTDDKEDAIDTAKSIAGE